MYNQNRGGYGGQNNAMMNQFMGIMGGRIPMDGIPKERIDPLNFEINYNE